MSPDFVVGSLSKQKATSDEALRFFKTSPFFRTWHPDVLRLYVNYALCEDSQGGVKLKMSSLQEALVLANRVGAAEAWELLEKLDERIELRWVVPGKSTDKGCAIPDLSSQLC